MFNEILVVLPQPVSNGFQMGTVCEVKYYSGRERASKTLMGINWMYYAYRLRRREHQTKQQHSYGHPFSLSAKGVCP